MAEEQVIDIGVLESGSYVELNEQRDEFTALNVAPRIETSAHIYLSRSWSDGEVDTFLSALGDFEKIKVCFSTLHGSSYEVSGNVIRFDNNHNDGCVELTQLTMVAVA